MSDDEAPGWASITAAFSALYGDQEPAHRALVPGVAFGGALEGISAYRADWGWHFVTYGLTELFGKESDDTEVSGWGYELTMLTAGGDEPPEWAWRLLHALAAAAVRDGRRHDAGDRIDLGEPLDGGTSALTALAIRDDPLAEPQPSPFGRYRLLQLVGVTAEQLEEIRAGSTEAVLARLTAGDGLLRTAP